MAKSSNGPLTEEHKQKLSEATKGRKLKPRNKQWCENISKSKKGVPSKLKGKKTGPMSDEAKKNISIALTGRVFSEEHKRNLSLAIIKYNENLKRSGEIDFGNEETATG